MNWAPFRRPGAGAGGALARSLERARTKATTGLARRGRPGRLLASCEWATPSPARFSSPERTSDPGQLNLPDRPRPSDAAARKEYECPMQSFADLGVSKSVARALAAGGIDSPFAVQTTVIPDVLAGSRRPRQGADRLRQDARLRRAARRAARGDRRTRRGARPRADARARQPGDRGADRGRPRAGALRGRGLRRCRDRAPEQAGAPRAHPGRHARPSRGPDRARRRAARPRPRARARRGRPHARHGLPPGRRPHRGPDAQGSPDALPVGHARGRGRAHRDGLHARRAPARAEAGRGSPDRAPLHRGGARGEAGVAGAGAGRRGARPHARVRADQARRRPAREAPREARRERGGDPRQPHTAAAREGPEPLPQRRDRHPGRDRRGRARHRRGRRDPRDQLRRARRTATPTCTAWAAPDGPAGAAWASRS